ncbi:putative GTPase [Candidatus Calditenuaceae archaeon HR02]|nr:putative GTPase [Candidatus Calditenuaceae archaeon HR02]
MSGVDQLVDGVLAGDTRSLARVISIVEARGGDAEAILSRLAKHLRGRPVIGFSGPPGSGKSTIIGRIGEYLKGNGLKVAVLAIDPSSPFTGGAVLGDRVRMVSISSTPGVFIRSMATRGARGGVVAYVRAVLRVLDAAGFDVILVETAGAGQTDVSINDVADVVAVVVTPDIGDSIQAIKAGLLEIGDVYVVNKADDSRSSYTASMLEAMLGRGGDRPVVLRTVATRGEGVDVLAETLLRKWEQLKSGGGLQARRRRQTIAEVAALIMEDFRVAVERFSTDEEFVSEVERLIAEGFDPKVVSRKMMDSILEWMKKVKI